MQQLMSKIICVLFNYITRIQSLYLCMYRQRNVQRAPGIYKPPSIRSPGGILVVEFVLALKNLLFWLIYMYPVGIGLDWIGLHCIGFDWTGLVWIVERGRGVSIINYIYSKFYMLLAYILKSFPFTGGWGCYI